MKKVYVKIVGTGEIVERDSYVAGLKQSLMVIECFPQLNKNAGDMIKKLIADAEKIK